MERTTAPNSVAGLHVDKVPGVTVGTTGIALDRNNLQEEIVNAILGSGASLAVAQTQLRDAIISLSQAVGEPVFNLLKLSPSTSFPAVRVDDADHDIAVANWPDLVAALRAQKLESDGVTDFSGTVAGSVFTLPDLPANNRLVAALAEEELVHGTYTNWLALNIAGTDYAITLVSPGTRAITVTGSPPTGAQTGIVYPYRIAGSSTTARLRRMSGRALAGNDDQAGTGAGELLAGMRRRDRFQGHWHQMYSGSATGDATGTLFSTASTVPAAVDPVYPIGPIADAVNGTPRTGATTDPRAQSAYLYLWGGRWNP